MRVARISLAVTSASEEVGKADVEEAEEAEEDASGDMLEAIASGAMVPRVLSSCASRAVSLSRASSSAASAAAAPLSG